MLRTAQTLARAGARRFMATRAAVAAKALAGSGLTRDAIKALSEKKGVSIASADEKELDAVFAGNDSLSAEAIATLAEDDLSRRSAAAPTSRVLSELLAHSTAPGLASLATREEGEFGTFEYRIHYELDGKPASPWHDLPLKNEDGSFNFVVEIPKWTRAKMEIDTDGDLNPIKQDTKKGNLRYYDYGDMAFNYGALPQTWEDPAVKDPKTGIEGDDDPVDVVEVGFRQFKMGSVVPVKILGSLAMIDDGETDWKVLAISTEDPLAPQVDDIDDLMRVAPGLVESVRHWFASYKAPKINEFAFDGQPLNKAETLEVIDHAAAQWASLRSK